MLVLPWIVAIVVCAWFDEIKCNLLEATGFHCKQHNSMRLDRTLHGMPHKSTPPFEFYVMDDEGNESDTYEPGKIYRLRLVGYIHFRGFMIQARLATPNGYLIGALRGGRFILNERTDLFDVQHHSCDRSQSNNSLTHANNTKKFLVEVEWTTDRDIGSVQFMLTIAVENGLYWERWRPRNGFLRPKSAPQVPLVDWLFEIEVQPGREEPTLSPDEKATMLPPEEVTTTEPFDARLFEEMEKAEQAESKRASKLLRQSTLNEARQFRGQGNINSRSILEMTTMQTPSNGANITHVTRRSFKKFSPSKRDHLRDDDLRFLNSHVQLRQHDFVDTKMDPEETCRHSNPCANGGICVVMVEKRQIRCECPTGFTGTHCTEIDMCLNHACVHNSTCKNGPKGSYTCQCQRNTVGTYCQFVCKEDQCSGNGECIMEDNGRIGCRCNPGFTGSRCEREMDECELNKCKNSVKCIDKFDDYECVCEDGWIGKNCDRPCEDIYGSCKFWKREEQCEIPREETDFFEINCPVTCGKCKPLNDTITNTKIDRLSAALLPLSWILGEWHTEVRGFQGRAIDFPSDFNASGYNETVIFSVAKPVMFGTPSIGYSSTAVSHDDPKDIHTYNGFLTIRQYPPKDATTIKVALTSVNNQGTVMVEEGPLDTVQFTSGPRLSLTSTYRKIHGSLDDMLLNKASRSFTRKGMRLIQAITKEQNGRKIKFKKIYNQIRKFEFL
ncbi:hypothetical protein KIN20_023120 [Parelaphostrongylus tenuis]|uniref:Uncharacterized protein n=1 Tax=Parelaphostrongylus tenuis TaxID=148309 RepID=A0AAD5QSR6_PARTN|nr:hypothetical protein KIN20_023120 [Parelaphostrongylus tenuis]